jgi:hypothetical protein
VLSSELLPQLKLAHKAHSQGLAILLAVLPASMTCKSGWRLYKVFSMLATSAIRPVRTKQPRDTVTRGDQSDESAPQGTQRGTKVQSASVTSSTGRDFGVTTAIWLSQSVHLRFCSFKLVVVLNTP